MAWYKRVRSSYSSSSSIVVASNRGSVRIIVSIYNAMESLVYCCGVMLYAQGTGEGAGRYWLLVY